MTFRRTRCPHCKGKLEAGQRIHPDCIDGYAEAQAAKKEREAEKKARMAARVEKAETKRKLEAIKTNGQHKADAQKAINRWVLHVRDAGKPCISCGRHHQGAWHAGHYRSRGSAPHLALDPRNLAKQCAPCNLYLHGNLIGYRNGLIEREGEAFVLALEADQDPRNYRASDYQAIKAEYNGLYNEWKKGNK